MIRAALISLWSHPSLPGFGVGASGVEVGPELGPLKASLNAIAYLAVDPGATTKHATFFISFAWRALVTAFSILCVYSVMSVPAPFSVVSHQRPASLAAFFQSLVIQDALELLKRAIHCLPCHVGTALFSSPPWRPLQPPKHDPSV